MHRLTLTGVFMILGSFGHHRAENIERTACIRKRGVLSRPDLSRDAASFGKFVSLEFGERQFQRRVSALLAGKK